MRDENGILQVTDDVRLTPYEFVDKDGNVKVFEFEMLKVPSIGKTIQRKGVKWTRIMSTNMQPYVEPDVHVQTHSLPRQRPKGHPDYADYKYPETDKKGKPRWKSLKQIREWSSMQRQYTWDRSTMIGQRGGKKIG